MIVLHVAVASHYQLISKYTVLVATTNLNEVPFVLRNIIISHLCLRTRAVYIAINSWQPCYNYIITP